MSGQELKAMAEAAGLSPVEICHVSGIKSPTTVNKVYNDDHVKPTTRVKIEKAIKRLSEKQAVAG